MKIYLYDKNTKCFIREKEAYVNPVKRTEFLLDKNSTKISPFTKKKLKKYEQYVFDIETETWSICVDVDKCKAYLNETDWYITRSVERDIPIPAKIKNERLRIFKLL